MDLIRPLAVAALTLVTLGPAGAAPAKRMSTTCVEDDQVPTPKGYEGWERSSVVAWQAIEDHGGIVPDIEEDRAHAPPAWLRYPSPRPRSCWPRRARRRQDRQGAAVRGGGPADPAGRSDGRARAGACGKMAIVAGLSDDGGSPSSRTTRRPRQTRTRTRCSSTARSRAPGGGRLPDDVKKDSTSATCASSTATRAPGAPSPSARPHRTQGRGAADEKPHDPVDEATSLAADKAFTSSGAG
jgi:hypothetical protein